MQRCNVTVRLVGDTGNTVEKHDVTVAEIAVLRAIHGPDAVVNVRPVRQCKTPHREERDRLARIYSATTKDGHNLVMTMFPGAMPSLPVHLADIVVVDPNEIEVEANEPPQPKAPAASSAPVEGQDGIENIDPEAETDDGSGYEGAETEDELEDA